MRQEISDKIIKMINDEEKEWLYGEQKPLIRPDLIPPYPESYNTMEDLVGYDNITYVDIKDKELVTVKDGRKYISVIPMMSFIWDEFYAKHLDMVADDGN